MLLGHEDWGTREQAEKLLSHMQALPVLTHLTNNSECPEIRIRAGRLAARLRCKAELDLYADPGEYYQWWHTNLNNKAIPDKQLIQDLQNNLDRLKMFQVYAIPGTTPEKWQFLRKPYSTYDLTNYRQYTVLALFRWDR